MTKSESEMEALNALQRYFESQFGTGIVQLVAKETKLEVVLQSDDSEFDDDEYLVATNPETTVVEFKEFKESKLNNAAPILRESRNSFMSSKPPSSKTAAQLKHSRGTDDDDDDDDSINLKHDVALQRLLRESHLLHKEASSERGLELTGKSRIKALEQYATSLGGKVKADRTPMRIKRGIKEKAQKRKEKNAREAMEAGIVTSKEKKVKKRVFKKNSGLDNLHRVGKFKGGTLSINESEIRRVNRAGQKAR
ncbi:hypothetical protein NEOLI_004687 [Neolecta irregularis DAH-3]|uniref:Protein FAF1 n=1 Tax=Neolecta irregularis (strain DAH-3) TaxID=1198029 RepID=A0A1U7LJH0_NEOID|nr:hypothetical protein NEOLI_004687 [Neolecta irregularis DAH-3]|eukprot:OLL22794.1 hypothetical protein NEOLI_004687 [Neolecta irregularis DAH-3]